MIKYPRDNYPDSDIVESFFVVKLFHRRNVRDEYLDKLLPQAFYNHKLRLVVYVMKYLHKKKIDVTVENVIMYLKSENTDISAFMKKHQIKPFNYNDIFDIANDMSSDSRDDFISVAHSEILRCAFSRFVWDQTFDIEELNSSATSAVQKRILSKVKGMERVHQILYNRIYHENKDQLQSAMNLINNEDEYVPTLSRSLNKCIGGFTRKFVDSIGAKSSHGKSSFVDANVLYNIKRKDVEKVLIVTPEEPSETRWRRIIADICHISTTDMRQKEVKIDSTHIDAVRSVVGDRITFVEKINKMSDVMQALGDIEYDMAYVDHLQSIEYPGNGSYLMNMIGNIPALINFEKRMAAERNVPIVNLSQVNDKEIQRSDRISKAPRYWDMYGSSALYQAAREMIMIHYPYKDLDETSGIMYVNEKLPTLHDIRIGVEKSSFSAVGNIYMYFEPDYNIFVDMTDELNKNKYEKIKQDVNQLNLM